MTAHGRWSSNRSRPRRSRRCSTLPPAEALDAYTVIGGFPVLALEWGRGRTREDYLADALTDPTSFLVISAEKTLAAEFPVDAQARAVLSAVGATLAPTRRSSRAPDCPRHL